ncbi:magnesium transport protein CorA [Nocardioides szechwanensis]|uniref:Magnesium transport protein CorA n=1 Tax=Nocardioides szechwanensis TaxID=1005944 RepID=A0A1G9X501_9ACTN|nr:magnesium/cobalt transporter CorA [Nocardioides szechwanensis]GEP32426.1 magnesium transport protein CorA [Nocardioides szechwanensis]SDM91767.1 magnesium transporter [Nocardioides szechwanensis]
MIVDSAVYRNGERVAVDCRPQDYATLRAQAKAPGDFVWVGLHQPGQAELERVAEAFGLHHLAVEDAVKAHQRPKLERYDDNIFLILKTLWYVEAEDAVETGEISMFVGSDFVITVRHGEGGALHSARKYLEQRSKVLTHGPSAVVYAVCDSVVDAYSEVVAELEADVDEVEESVFSPARTNDSVRIYTLKREIAEVRRAVHPLRDPMRRFASGLVPGIDEAAAPFFRDVADHLTRASEIVDSLDGLLSTAFDAHLARISVQQNDDMRKISAGVGLVAAPTLIAGVYGMNFDHMPELHWMLGYPFALLLMVMTSAALWVFFKKSGWL